MEGTENAHENISAGSQAEPANNATPAACPPIEELLAWVEHHTPSASPEFGQHLQNCPRCAHLIELAASAETGSGIDAGFEDQDLLAIQPSLRTPAPPAAKARVSTSAKNKTPKVPGTTWELLTGRPAPSRKS